LDTSTTTAIIGAGAALLGAVVAQLGTLLKSGSDRSDKKRTFHLERLEELAENLYQTVPWAENLIKELAPRESRFGSSAGTNGFTQASIHARRVYVLALLYFPKLRDNAKIFMDSCNRIYIAVTSSAPVDLEELGKAVKDFRSSLGALTEQVTSTAETII